jgi:hypothetical protein
MTMILSSCDQIEQDVRMLALQLCKPANLISRIDADDMSPWVFLNSTVGRDNDRDSGELCPKCNHPDKMERDDVPSRVSVDDAREIPRPRIDLQSQRREEPSPRYQGYFLPDEDINYEVIQNDICRYLGNDATVQPGQYSDVGFHSPNGLKHPYSG